MLRSQAPFDQSGFVYEIVSIAMIPEVCQQDGEKASIHSWPRNTHMLVPRYTRLPTRSGARACTPAYACKYAHSHPHTRAHMRRHVHTYSLMHTCAHTCRPNGAGKTTSINMLTGLIRPSGGDALIAGYSIRRDMPKIHRLMGVCPQHDLTWCVLSA